MSTAVAQDEAQDLRDRFAVLFQERKHVIARDLFDRRQSAPVAQLRAIVGHLEKQPYKDVDARVQAVEAETDQRPAPARQPRTTSEPIPDGRYAIPDGSGDWKFYGLEHGKKGSKWENTQFMNLLVGQPGTEYAEYPVKNRDSRNQIFRAIREMGIEASQLKAAQEMCKCIKCGSPLSDPVSRETGYGPHCRKNH